MITKVEEPSHYSILCSFSVSRHPGDGCFYADAEKLLTSNLPIDNRYRRLRDNYSMRWSAQTEDCSTTILYSVKTYPIFT